MVMVTLEMIGFSNAKQMAGMATFMEILDSI
eukprot:CAMPEP_0176374458 /NCGR_PEP_ID=MMETSP0126-20121128/26772_1 /TAXON_ID=141414 ORGANISM="Strombidinopsis acuminatum, Strain SPMC142" /NCGR_SAMPLE_ID=MMETSP0126 /ASSEMBLY_ACC=CAM_ASM_000229 /LENGTH=30 /DNA_ID= /DNA_START= /DNA_END= /DNA_ORIENTATION=